MHDRHNTNYIRNILTHTHTIPYTHTQLGALAGIMWVNIIKSQPSAKRLVCPTAVDLSYYGALVLVPVMTLTCMSIVLQSYMYRI